MDTTTQHPNPATNPTAPLTPEQEAGRASLDVIASTFDGFGMAVARPRALLLGHTEDQMRAEADALRAILRGFAGEGAYGAWKAAGEAGDAVFDKATVDPTVHTYTLRNTRETVRGAVGALAHARAAMTGRDVADTKADICRIMRFVDGYSAAGWSGALEAVRDDVEDLIGAEMVTSSELVEVEDLPTVEQFARGIAIGTAYADHGTRGGPEPLLDHADLIAPTIAAYMRDGRVGVGTLFMAGADEPATGADSPIAA